MKLADVGLVEHRVDSVQPHQAGGRPARVSRFRPDAGYVAGVDLVGTTVKVALADLSGTWIHTGAAELATPTSANPSLDPVVTAVHAVLDDAGADGRLLKAVGVGTSGVVRADGTMMTSPFVRPWVERNIRDELTALIGVPVTVDNDLTLAAFAESRMGALRDTGTALYAETFHNMAVRVVIDGNVVRGRRRVAGELGVLKVFNAEGYRLETYFDDLARFEVALLALRDGSTDPSHLSLRDELVASMAKPLAAMTLAVDPDVIALGGRLGRFADALVPQLIESLHDASIRGPVLDTRIVGAELGRAGILVGAIDQAFALHAAEIYGLPVDPPVQNLIHDSEELSVHA
ncbi:ROK family protein [Isoptericola hypogeus]|uniref:ROK family protein n=1 Tax=Isoptericola hypogeus TaxID=300179 RepID=UPI0031DE6E03